MLEYSHIILTFFNIITQIYNMANKRDTTVQRHRKWLDYYNLIVSDYKNRNPGKFQSINKMTFFQEVADHFDYDESYVRIVLNRLLKNNG